MQLLRLPAVCERTGLSRARIYVLAKRGEFPQPVKIGTRASAWPALEVDEWIESRVRERDAATGRVGP